MHHTLTVDRPTGAVLRALTAFDRIPEWIPTIDVAYQQSPGAAQVGTTFVEEFRIIGRRTRIVGTVTELEPDRMFSYRYDDWPIPGLWSYRLFGDGERTRLEFTLEMSTRGFFSTGNPLVFAVIKRTVRKNLAAFKAWIEADASTPSVS